ncbi:MFS transporter [Comamonas thiooxydans]|uniref:MFS transporter n=1 Tax=Comamonas thiooxydans TaxID=363952 RepID=A0AA42Q244_9BURK|nr:MFS transporter [Comamonas thiooxydans]MDH1334784.1 MFS transporter [Comamonas thiooxydans]MDH1740770.1 MFS transporter [Comamonas thiooxydans]MDH1786964.1 MFS transporter [Comamonas thiooxydans]
MNSSVVGKMDDKPMSAYQWFVIALCFLINMLDGFDVLVMAFTAASVASQWALSGVQLGYLLSAGLVGMALGSLVIAPWADRIGRRPLIMLCIAIAGVGMLASAYTQSAVQLGALRLFTGLGIGGILASSYVIAGEYASSRWRGLAISLQATAYALGATIGGLIATQLIPSLGWRSVFLYGGVATLVTLPVMFLWLPESLDFLIAKRPSNALGKMNIIRLKVGLEPLVQMPAFNQSTATAGANRVASLLAPGLAASTLLIWAAFFIVMFGFYFVMSWTPKLLVTAGLSNQQGITGGVLLNVGGIVGTSLIGFLAAKYRLSRVLMLYLIINAALMCTFVSLLGNLGMAFAAALAIGVFVNGCVAGLYALTPNIYTATQRVTGLGWAIGVGRIGAIVSPLVAGKLIDASWRPDELFSLYGLVFLGAALAVYQLQRRSSASTAPQPLVMHDAPETAD